MSAFVPALPPATPALQAHLEPLTPEHLDQLMAVETSAYPHPWTRGNFTDALESGNEAWILRRDARPVGYAVVLPVLDEAHLLTIGVLAPEQGKGLGRALLAQLIAVARGRDATRFFLEVRPSNEAALALYHSAGFEAVGRRRGYYPAAGGSGPEDAIVMRLAL